MQEVACSWGLSLCHYPVDTEKKPMEHPNLVLSLGEIICGYRILEVLLLGFLLDWAGIILKTRHKWSR